MVHYFLFGAFTPESLVKIYANADFALQIMQMLFLHSKKCNVVLHKHAKHTQKHVHRSSRDAQSRMSENGQKTAGKYRTSNGQITVRQNFQYSIFI